MKKVKVLNRPTAVSDLEFDDMHYEFNGDYDWQEKARALQVRRWRKLKRALKSPYTHAHAHAR